MHKNYLTMPQVTLSVPREKLPLLQDFLQSLGIAEKNVPYIFKKNMGRNTTRQTSSEVYQRFTWENYSNELEFE